MRNPRVTPKEWGLIKGALRRVFSRSELRRQALKQASVKHFDPNRPRVQKWSLCPGCGKYEPEYLMEVDHQDPIIPVSKTLHDMEPNELVDRMWCVIENLKALCKPCHKRKTAEERKKRSKKK